MSDKKHLSKEASKARVCDMALVAIRAHCIECSSGHVSAVKGCESRSCKLWPWRHGTAVLTNLRFPREV